MIPAPRLRRRPNSYDLALRIHLTDAQHHELCADDARRRWFEHALTGAVVLVVGLGLAWLCVMGAREVADRIASRLHGITVAEARRL